MKLLVTGADGFIGSHLVEQLVAEGHEVKALCYYNSFSNPGWLKVSDKSLMSSTEVVFGDIRDQSHMIEISKGIEGIFHLAALIAIPHSYVAPQSYVDTNVAGTLSMLNAARANNVQRFIHTSTSEVYGTAQFVPMTERHPLNAQSPYAATKIAADQLVNAFYTSFNLPTITIRPFNTFGPRQSLRAVIPSVIRQIVSGKSVIKTGSLSPTRDFTYVSDTVEGFVKALSSGNESIGKTINLGTGYEWSISQTIDFISGILDQKVSIENESVRIRPLNSEVERLLSDNNLAKHLLGWQPKYIGEQGFIDALTLTVKWYGKENNLDKFPSDSYIT